MLMENEILRILSKKLGDYKLEKKLNQYTFYCPFCHHYKKKLSVSLNDEIYHCWTCNESGTIFKLLKFVGYTKEEISKIDFKTKKFINKDGEKSNIIVLPNDYKSILEKNNEIYRKMVLNYAKSRGLTRYHIEYYNLGYSLDDRYINYLIIPSYDCNGDLNYYEARNIFNTDSRPKYLKASIDRSSIVPFESYINWKKPIILVEGFFDINIDFNCLPLFGSVIVGNHDNSSPLIVKLIQEQTPAIFLMLDPDAIKKTYEIAKKLFNLGFAVYFVNIYPNKDPGCLSYKEYKMYLNQAELINDKTLFKMRTLFK